MKTNNEALDQRLFRVVWVMWTPKKTNKEMFLGICGYNWTPAFIGDLLHALIVHDLYIDAEIAQCEEEERCLNLSCPFNKTTPETYARSKRNMPEEFVENFLKPRWTGLAGIVASYIPFAELARKAHIKDAKVAVIEIEEQE